MNGLAILSGGADSATLVYYLKLSHQVEALSFYYGQRHKREIDSARAIAERLGIRHDVIDISDAGRHLTGSALTSDTPVPHGHYQAENMKLTVVPNRNAIMLAIARGIALARKLEFIAYGAHGGDHLIYPDCRPSFIEAIQRAFNRATDSEMEIKTPFLYWDKAKIIKTGIDLKVPFELTWTCYEGGSEPCGKCGSCTERAEAFAKAGARDPLMEVQDAAC